MHLTLIGKDPESTRPGRLPCIERIRDSWLVQGWIVTDPEALSQLNIPDERVRLRSPTGSFSFSGSES